MRISRTVLAKWSDNQVHLFVLTMVTAVAWAPALAGSFHYDDLPNIVLDPATSHWDALLARLGNGFRPLLRLSYAADHALWGFSPAGFLVTNFLVHLATVAAVWRLASTRLNNPLAALLAALVFALQPAHAEAVAWVSGRSTELSTLLLCLALLAHERGAERGGWKWPTASAALMTLAAAVKEVALAFPLIVMLWEFMRPGESNSRQAIRRAAPVALVAAGELLIVILGSSRLRELLDYSLATQPLDALTDQLRALPISLSLWFRPWALSVEHPNPTGTAPFVLGLTFVTALIAVAAWNSQRRPLLALALLWPLLTLLPSHSFIARNDLVVEKPLYGAWIGPSLAIGALLAAALRNSRAMTLRALPLILLAALFGATQWRAFIWADPAALWHEATISAPQSLRAWNNRAISAASAQRWVDARIALEHAKALKPDAPGLEDIEQTLNLLAPEEAPTP